MKTDTIKRDDMKPAGKTFVFDRQSPEARVILARAASRGAANGSVEILKIVHEDCGGWLMVPTRSGLRQVAIDAESGRAWRF